MELSWFISCVDSMQYIYFHCVGNMAMRKKPPTYSTADLKVAVSKTKANELTFRPAEARYRVPHSTLYDHVCGRVSSSKRGPPTVLTTAEENLLAQWALDMAEIGYVRTREQLQLYVCEMVKTMLDKDDGKNPFTENKPGKDWRYAFLCRHPVRELHCRSPEPTHAQLQ